VFLGDNILVDRSKVRLGSADRRRWRRVVAGLAGAALASTLLASAAGAQTVPRQLPSTVEPGRSFPNLPVPVPEADFNFTIPTPQRQPLPRPGPQLRIPVTEIIVEGATVFSRDDLEPLYRSLIGREATLPEIAAVADAIADKYFAAGYPLTRAVVPPQRVVGGKFTIRVIEGYVRAVAVEGADPNVQERIKSYLAAVTEERPTRLATLERALLLANDLPGVSASSVLRPSPNEVGAADLVTSLQEKPVDASLSFDNRGTSYVGPYNLSAEAFINNQLGWGERIGIGAATTPGNPNQQKAYSLRYLQPLRPALTLLFGANYSTGRPGFTLQPLNVQSQSLVVGPRLNYALEVTRHQRLSAEIGFALHDAKTNVLGQPFNDDHYRNVDLRVSYSQFGFLHGLTAAAVDFSKGIPGLGASHPGAANLSRPDGRPDYAKVVGEVRRIQEIYGPVSLMVAGYGQFAFSPLLAGEEFALGNTTVGRGYDPSEVVGDHGIAGVAELRFDYPIDRRVLNTGQYYLFYDNGQAWKIHGSTNSGRSVVSAGAGIRLGFVTNTDLNLEIAKPLGRAPNADNGRKPLAVYITLIQRY
jgi:hemolysin activation/secretion protein